MAGRYHSIEIISISISDNLLKTFREKYKNQGFKGDTEALNHLIRKYTGVLND